MIMDIIKLVFDILVIVLFIIDISVRINHKKEIKKLIKELEEDNGKN